MKRGEIYEQILYMGFAGYLEVAAPEVRKIFTASSSFGKIIKIIIRPFALLFKAITHFFISFGKSNSATLRDQLVLFSLSKNNRDSLRFVKAQKPSAIFLVTKNEWKEKNDVLWKYEMITFLNLWRFPFLCYHFYKKYGTKVFAYADYLFRATGLFEASLFLLKRNRPKAMVFSNDHSPRARALLLAAKELGIPTVYIQHASVHRFFPPLIFDLNLLEGQDTKDKYLAIGPITGKVEFVGMQKFDAYIDKRNTATQVKRIGICTNRMDEPKAVAQFVDALVDRFPKLQFTLRPHPADDRMFPIKRKVQRSNGKEETAFEFLLNQDLIIAGNTSIHLEATLMNLVSLYYEYTPQEKTLSDIYGYCKNGLTTHYPTIESLSKQIEKEAQNKTNVVGNATYYNALAGTKDEGKSTILAMEYITGFLEKITN